MKVVIGPYTNWIGPYQIAEALCFWSPKVKDECGIPRHKEWVHDFGGWLAENKDGSDSWLLKVCNWIEARKKRQVYVRIDKYDSWSADHTLALIALPLLRQLQATKHGAPNVDDEDVPEHLRSTNAPPKENDWDIDANHFSRWDWVMNEIIWALDQKVNDTHEQQFFSEKVPDLQTRNFEEMMDNFQIDHSGLQAWQERKTRGYKLFGKYFEHLWD